MPESEDARWLAGWVARNFDKPEHPTAVECAERILAAPAQPKGWECTVDDDGWRRAEQPGDLTGGVWSFHPEHGMQARGPEDSDKGPPDCPPDVVRWLVARPC